MRGWIPSLLIGRKLLSYIGLTVGIIFVLVWLEPFSTDQLSPLMRSLYWSIAVIGNMIMAMILIPLFVEQSRKRKSSPLLGVAVGSILAAIPGTANIFTLEFIMRAPLKEVEILALYFDVMIITFCISTIFFLFTQNQQKQSAAVSSGDDHDFLIELTGGAKLLHLEIKDHYLQVFTDQGTRTVLMRMRDAIRQLDKSRGLQVHRSHWLAHDAVSHVERQDGRIILHSVDGRKIPVSRSYLKSVRAAPWFE